MKGVDEGSTRWAAQGRALGAVPVKREQFSVKITEEACRRFRRMAEERGVTLGALFEQALEALERQRSCEDNAPPERVVAMLLREGVHQR